MNASTEFDTAVRLNVYELFFQTGRAPGSQEVAASLSCPPAQVKEAFARLGAGKAIVLENESGEILMANPFCAIPTPFLVEIGDRSWFAACIWDALGIAAMLKEEALIRASCGCCSEGMSVRVGNGGPAGAEGIIHFGVPAKRWWDNITFT